MAQLDSVVPLGGLLASRIVATDVNTEFASVDLKDWIAGTTNQVTVTDLLNGKVQLSLPQDIAPTSNVQFAQVMVGYTGSYKFIEGGIQSTGVVGLSITASATGIFINSISGTGPVQILGAIQLSTLSGILKGTSGAVSAITDNSSNWNTAYGWGNHASVGYLTSFTEVDPVAMQYLDQSVKVASAPQFAGLTILGTPSPQFSLKYDASNYASLSESAAGVLTITSYGSGVYNTYGIKIDKGSPTVVLPASFVHGLQVRVGSSDSYNEIAFAAEAERNNSVSLGASLAIYGLNAFAYLLGSGDVAGPCAGGRYATYFTGGSASPGPIITDIRGVSAFGNINPSAGNYVVIVSAASLFAEALTVDTRGTITNAYGIYVKAHTVTREQTYLPYGVITNAFGAWFEKQTVGGANYGIVLDGDGVGSNIVLGADQDASIYYDGTNTVINPKLVGSGLVNILGGVECDSLRIDQTPAAGTITPDKTIIISCDGADYKFACVAA